MFRDDQFGQRLRNRRLNRNMTLQSLAEASGVSVSMLSQVERGERVPTLPIALSIAEGLGCHLSEILDGAVEMPHGLVHRERASGVVDPETGVRRLLLSRRLPPSVVEVTWYRLPRGVHLGPFIHRDPNLLEQITVVTGRLQVTIGEEIHALGVGDSLSFRGSVEHGFENPGNRECSFVHISHPSTP